MTVRTKELVYFMSVKCTPICPFRAFYCTKRALTIRRKGNRIIAFCSWIGDECIGYKCQYATCSRHALILPDGLCKLKMRKQRKRETSIEEEATKLEPQFRSLRQKLRKLSFDLEKLE